MVSGCRKDGFKGSAKGQKRKSAWRRSLRDTALLHQLARGMSSSVTFASRRKLCSLARRVAEFRAPHQDVPEFAGDQHLQDRLRRVRRMPSDPVSLSLNSLTLGQRLGGSSAAPEPCRDVGVSQTSHLVDASLSQWLAVTWRCLN
jgi:hypothetical protein